MTAGRVWEHRITQWGGYTLGVVYEGDDRLFDHFQCPDGSVFLVVEPDSPVRHRELEAYKTRLREWSLDFEVVPGRDVLLRFPATDPLLKAAIEHLFWSARRVEVLCPKNPSSSP